ncbi:MAG: sugar transporter [Sphingobacteriales bacterium]|nr:sugar transporter [Sphingobacteriales bacterium]
MSNSFKPMKTLSRGIIFLFLGIFSSCSSYKQATYFQDLSRVEPTKESVTNLSALKIQPDDVLGISVSSLNAEASAVFNFTSNINGVSESYGGYMVNPNGEIEMPLIGFIKASNLTTSQFKDAIRKRLIPYLKEPVVRVNVINFKVSVMGDVNQPGVFKAQNEKFTITDALTMAGDLNITAKRKIILIREVDQVREYIPIDLTSKNLFNSPYYYLKNNDIIYVEAGKAKYASIDQTYPKVGLLLSLISIAAFLLGR